MDAEALRVAVFQWFARTGRAPDADDLAGLMRCDAAAVTGGLRELAAAATWSWMRRTGSSWRTRSPPCRAAPH